MAFCNSALASAEEEQARLRGQLKEQRLRCKRLARLVAPGTTEDSVPGETHQALQVAMDKLQVSESAPARPRRGRRWLGRAAEP